MPRLLGRKTVRYGSVTSTNLMLKELAMAGIEAGTVVTATVQTEGRGRLGRKWESPEGGLWMSVLLEFDRSFDIRRIGLLPLMAGASVATAVAMEYDMETGVKWPNDVLVGGRKLCGILCEFIEPGERRCAITGIGVNVNNPVRADYAFSHQSTSVAEECARTVPLEVLENTILEELDFRWGLLSEGNFQKLVDDWQDMSLTVGKHVTVETPSGIVRGIARGIDQTGALVVETSGETRSVNAGDCQHLE